VIGDAEFVRPVVLSRRESAALLGKGELTVMSAVLVPIMDGDLIRAITLFISHQRRFYTPSRVLLADELLTRFGLALEAALMYEASQATLNGVQETLATAIHDLMSPLTYIKGTAQRLGRVECAITDAQASSEFGQRLRAINSAVDRMGSALTSLLETTRPLANQLPRAPAPQADLVETARGVVAAEQLLARDHALQLCEGLSELHGPWETEQLERLLGNLVGNAIKYSPPGSRVDVSVLAEADSEGHWAVLRVADQGVGIPARDLPFVFEPFRRGSNIGAVGGSGLGLASVWQIVKSLDGRLRIDSQEGKGTCVQVRLPLSATSR
jgi:signal transduction histidine kinase